MDLRQSTANQPITLGTFVDDTDGKTTETGLTINNTDIKLAKAGAVEVAKNSGGATHDAGGRYRATLDATDTNTLGRMEINVHVSGALPIRREFNVLAQAVYDVKYGTTAPSTLDAAGVRTAVGLATANLDAQLTAINDFLDTEIAAIKAKTDSLPSDPADASDIVASFATISAAISGLNNLSAAQVNAEMLDVLNVDTFSLPSQGAPPATWTLRQAIGYLYKAWRNKMTQTEDTYKLFADDATTVDQKATTSDDGETFTRDEVQSGP